ncbi:extracellular solute-binding protein [Nitratireductor thuwali]|uniref:Oligopeptide-binding protein AppA n=1 Tax=Nitratireductor thuwali TaxID=2267699 RepID=A0ABY5MKZ5_9HYPH|nr:Oligopeptide-binding protein AppA [Nitratireductor thuwali]
MANNGITRRDVLAGLGAAALSQFLPTSAWSAVPTAKPLHGLSTFGELKYGPDFTHFDYANPDAPKGGTCNFAPGYWYFNQNVLTFNTLNSFVRTGDAPPRMEYCFDTLMAWAWDEPDARYGLLAESVTLSEDRNTLTFKLRPEARFHDGSPVTAEDVAYSYNLMKEKGHPQLSLMLTEMTEAVAQDVMTFRLTFSGNQSVGTTLSAISDIQVLSRASVEEHGFDSSKIHPLLGSGPYKVGRVSAGRYIEYDRVEDYWARDLPVQRGLNHFDTIRIDFYRDRNAGFEAFKKGDIFFREEFTARSWATQYDFPAAQEGKVVKREIPLPKAPRYQAWAINQRRERFRDRRVRQAIELCFDFEWTRRNIFYDAYERADSMFENSPYKAEGLPSKEVLALLESLPGNVPEEAFGEAVKSPVADGSGKDRQALRRARQLMMEAGWKLDGQLLRNEKGEAFTLEFLDRDVIWQRILSPFIENLRSIGIDASLRIVDPAQYQARVVSYDFDLVSRALRFEPTPTKSSLEQHFHSSVSNVEGSYNLPGATDPSLDALVEAVGRAQSREELTIAMRALDRVVRARRDWIPTWGSNTSRIAYWDMFGYSELVPDYFFAVEVLWWHDADRAQAIGKA